jgi:hypothetical protein
MPQEAHGRPAAESLKEAFTVVQNVINSERTFQDVRKERKEAGRQMAEEARVRLDNP